MFAECLIVKLNGNIQRHSTAKKIPQSKFYDNKDFAFQG